MQNYVVHLQSPISESYFCQKAANSLDIDVAKKSVHHLSINADLNKPYKIGLIIGASGSGKTTLAKKIWGQDVFQEYLDPTKPIIDQFPESYSYEDRATCLNAIGLTSVVCWIRPAATLSNGQRSRAEAALALTKASKEKITVIDEWTSVVDRTVAKVMSHCVQKFARRQENKIVLLSCHYDVVEWLNPDWIIDCNKQEYIDRRSMVGSFERSDRLRLDIREVDRKTWPYFSKYHYLNSNLPGGKVFTYGLYNGVDQIGFQCFAAYIIGNQNTFFSNRTVIHPDYAGLGLGIKLITETSKDMVRKGYRVKAKFSSTPVYKAMMKQPEWKLTKIHQNIKKKYIGRSPTLILGEKHRQKRSDLIRNKVTSYSFDFIWK